MLSKSKLNSIDLLISKALIDSVLSHDEFQKSKSCKNKNGRITLLSKCAMGDSKKLKFIKEQEASELLSRLGIKIPLSKISLVGPILLK